MGGQQGLPSVGDLQKKLSLLQLHFELADDHLVLGLTHPGCHQPAIPQILLHAKALRGPRGRVARVRFQHGRQRRPALTLNRRDIDDTGLRLQTCRLHQRVRLVDGGIQRLDRQRLHTGLADPGLGPSGQGPQHPTQNGQQRRSLAFVRRPIRAGGKQNAPSHPAKCVGFQGLQGLDGAEVQHPVQGRLSVVFCMRHAIQFQYYLTHMI